MKANPITAYIPVIVLTSLSQKNEDKLRKAGAFAYLEKGALLDHPQTLLDVIEAALKGNGGYKPPDPAIPSSVPAR
ncbi:MAG TPA: hypothetical protein VG759_09155 [Candidatus Angelobacter sp.]|nr:hypothetical protein [Candidatus Angelobacter sp.]